MMKYQMCDGKNLYDFVYVGNLVDAHILAARALLGSYGKPPPLAAQRVDGENINITNNERILFWEFTRKVAAEAGYPVSEHEVISILVWFGLFMAWCSERIAWIQGAPQPAMTVEAIRLSIINRALSVEKAKHRLAYQPTVSIDDAIQRGVQ